MTLTQEEYKQLEAIKVLYSWAGWMARDKNGMLYLYSDKPVKRKYDFVIQQLSDHFEIISQQLLPSLTWESEPLNIDEALEGREDYGMQGWTIDEILSHTLGIDTRSKLYNETIKLFEKALNEENYKEAKANYEILDKMLHPQNYLRKLLEIQLAGLGENKE